MQIWEAQFGDFANVAQHIIDNFIATGEAKLTPAQNRFSELEPLFWVRDP